MITGTTRTITLVAAVGAGVTGGVYFAFSTFVMRGLRRLPERQGLQAMQAINQAAPTPLFMTALFGTAALCVGLVVVGARRWGDAGAVQLVVGSSLYLVSVVLTIAFHVPRNDALDQVDAASAGAAQRWLDYASVWTLGNHVRTLAAIAGAALLAQALTTD
jgi:uncharacterized membrane protein